MYHNVYGILMTRATREGMMAVHPDRRPFVLSRSNYLGGQRYASTWTGDNHADMSFLKIVRADVDQPRAVGPTLERAGHRRL